MHVHRGSRLLGGKGAFSPSCVTVYEDHTTPPYIPALTNTSTRSLLVPEKAEILKMGSTPRQGNDFACTLFFFFHLDCGDPQHGSLGGVSSLRSQSQRKSTSHRISRNCASTISRNAFMSADSISRFFSILALLLSCFIAWNDLTIHSMGKCINFQHPFPAYHSTPKPTHIHISHDLVNTHPMTLSPTTHNATMSSLANTLRTPLHSARR
ncbi:hypothetical protein Hypma_012145 [Hypsizygus marmoreus]|uniref:Uncharacterized protein n=1 Tax=Hypsizygus marmoreus TaxID=39966 RepID=A0A369JJP2_HYPMA|nr:hypothetical protein Hypma_012145 [Hypsizygus marmoreus]